MTHQAPNPGHPAYDPADPHGFHKDAAGHDAHHQHHVSPWSLQVIVLAALLFFTLLTVATAQAETWLSAELGLTITQLWNVVIAMSIATVKAMLVCMYFMHLRHDNALNTYVVLFTLLTLGLFLMFPSIDTASRGYVNKVRAATPEATLGGTGAFMSRKDGTPITGPIIYQARREAIEKKAHEHADDPLVERIRLAAVHAHEHNGRMQDHLPAYVAFAARHALEVFEQESAGEPDGEGALSVNAFLDERAHWYYGAAYIWDHLYDAKAEHAHGKPIEPTPDDTMGFHALWASGALDEALHPHHEDPHHADPHQAGPQHQPKADDHGH